MDEEEKLDDGGGPPAKKIAPKPKVSEKPAAKAATGGAKKEAGAGKGGDAGGDWRPVLDAGVVEADGGWRLALDAAAFGVGAPDMAGLLAACRGSVILASGEGDQMSPPGGLRELRPDAATLAGLGHNAHVEDPRALWPLVDRLLAP